MEILPKAGFGGHSPPPWHVYILLCSDGLHDVGGTSNLEDRLHRHNLGHIHFTSTRLPVELIVYVSFKDQYKALAFEKYLKSGSGRAFSKRHLV